MSERSGDEEESQSRRHGDKKHGSKKNHKRHGSHNDDEEHQSGTHDDEESNSERHGDKKRGSKKGEKRRGSNDGDEEHQSERHGDEESNSERDDDESQSRRHGDKKGDKRRGSNNSEGEEHSGRNGDESEKGEEEHQYERHHDEEESQSRIRGSNNGEEEEDSGRQGDESEMGENNGKAKSHKQMVMTKFKKVADGGDKISMDDLVKVARLCGQNPTNKQINDAIQAAELFDNETFSEEDCHNVISCIQYGEDADADEDLETGLRKAFNVFDKDKSGYLDAKEFKVAMLNYGEALTENEIKDMLKMADINNDGKIQYNEFVNELSRKFD